MKLYYRDAIKNTSTLISEFTPIFVNEENLLHEIKIIISEYSDKSEEVQKNEITAYLNENYGKPNSDNLSLWLKEKFNFKYK